MKERELLKYGELGTKDYIPGAEILEAEEKQKGGRTIYKLRVMH